MNITTVLLALVVFLFIILIHEFGHFITAKLFKVPVPEFSIGFGPTILKKKKNETLYSLRAIPFGGYVRMVGEDEESEDENALCNKPVWQRIIIVAAGAFVNLLMGFVVFAVVFSSFKQVPVLKVDTVTPGTPAYAVMKPGDEIVGVNGKKVWYYKDFKFLLNTTNPAEELDLRVKRGSDKIDLKITPQYNEERGVYEIGINMAQEKNSFGGTLKFAFFEMFFIIKAIFYSLFMLVTGQLSLGSMSGPVGTVSIMSTAASYGLLSFLNLFAMLTVNVGIFNLLPLPALDGGRVFFLLIELVRGKPIPRDKEGMVHFVGLALLMLLMVFVTINDISVIMKK